MEMFRIINLFSLYFGKEVKDEHARQRTKTENIKCVGPPPIADYFKSPRSSQLKPYRSLGRLSKEE